MNTDTDLMRRCALASQELREQHAPATLLGAIHRRLDAAGEQARPRRWARWGWAGLSTGALALAVAFIVQATLPAVDAPQTAVAADGFVRLVSQDEWQRARADATGSWLVNTELAQSRLAALGLPYDPSRAGERVPAQLLMHSSGDVIAVRLSR